MGLGKKNVIFMKTIKMDLWRFGKELFKYKQFYNIYILYVL